VIVGAGSAGAVLANRLTEDGRTTVILLEAGGEATSFLVQLPVGFLRLLMRKEYDWSYEAEPDPSLGGRSWIWSAGRMLGGSSSINGQVYIRGTAHDFDQWAEMGATGWSFREILLISCARSIGWGRRPRRTDRPGRSRSPRYATRIPSATPS